MSEEKAHAKLSASGSERWLNCPASVSLSEKAPPQPSNKYAEEGTRAHEHLEKFLSNWLGLSKASVVNVESEDMLKAIRKAFEFITKRYNQKHDTMLLEARLDLSHLVPDGFGTGDIVIYEQYGELQVWDYKHGKGLVEVAEYVSGIHSLNTQLVYYALAAAHLFNYDFQKVTLGILQPRAEHKHGPIRSITVPMKELLKYKELFKKGVDRVQSKNPRTFVGRWCKWCPAREFNCPQHRQIQYEKVREMFDDDL